MSFLAAFNNLWAYATVFQMKSKYSNCQTGTGLHICCPTCLQAKMLAHFAPKKSSNTGCTCSARENSNKTQGTMRMEINTTYGLCRLQDDTTNKIYITRQAWGDIELGLLSDSSEMIVHCRVDSSQQVWDDWDLSWRSIKSVSEESKLLNRQTARFQN